MAQLIYSILALLLIMFLSMNMQRNVGRDQQEQSVNEVGTQLTGVGTEVLEQIGSQHFDWHNWNYEWSRRGVDKSGALVLPLYQPYCGRVAKGLEQASKLSNPAGPHFGGCSTLADPYGDCQYIEGFAGLPDFTITRDEFVYTVTVDAVEYVDPNDYTVVSATPTFAKRVEITVTNPYLYIGDDPNDTDSQFSLTLERVFTYGCLSEPELIPFVLSGDYCPSDPSNPSGSNRPLSCSRW